MLHYDLGKHVEVVDKIMGSLARAAHKGLANMMRMQFLSSLQTCSLGTAYPSKEKRIVKSIVPFSFHCHSTITNQVSFFFHEVSVCVFFSIYARFLYLLCILFVLHYLFAKTWTLGLMWLETCKGKTNACI